jgi:hypothetical protein
MSPRSAFEPLPPNLERRISERWKAWVPWVRIHLLRDHRSNPAVNAAVDGPEFRRFRKRHSQHIVDMMRTGISMRTIRRHRLDDPRIMDEVRAVLVAAAIRLGPVAGRGTPTGPDGRPADEGSQAAMVVLDPLALQETIQLVRRQVCKHFYLREMRDPELAVRTNRRSFVLPRQIAMYVARQLTGASLEEIGRQFGGRHHTTVLHSVNKIETIRSSDEALNRTIAELVDAVVGQT